MAPQLIATNGWLARGLARWMARARSSLPLPLSPWMRMLASPAATRCAFASRSSMSEERVTMSSRHSCPTPGLLRGGAAVQRERALDLVQQLFGVVGLGEVAEHAALGRGHRVGNRAVRGEDDHRQSGIRGLDLLEERHAVHAVHAQVGEHEVGTRCGDRGERALPVLHRGHVIAVGLEADGEEPQQIRVVVNQQQRGFSLFGHQRLGTWRSERLFSRSVRASSFCCSAVGALLLRFRGALFVAQLRAGRRGAFLEPAAFGR